MKKILFFILLALTAQTVSAKFAFDESKKYRFVCNYYGSGNIVLGAYHSSTAILYYATSEIGTSDDGWWYIEKQAKGYSLRNAKTGEYIYHDTQRENGVAKGLRMTSTMSDAAQWTFNASGNLFNIQNVSDATHYFDVRVDGTYLVGTYAGSGSGNNELFAIYDEDGNRVEDDGTVEPVVTPLSAYVDTLRLSDKEFVYDKSDSLFYFPVSYVNAGTDVTYTATLKAAPGIRLYIGDSEVTDSAEFVLREATADAPYAITVMRGDSVLATADLLLTFMPIVEVNVAGTHSSSYTQGTLRVNDPDAEGTDQLYHAKFKNRGATSSGYPKKAYAVKVIDADGNSLDAKFLDKRSDNNWILDAMYIDKACMRNRVATDLWKDMHTDPYYADRESKKVRTYTRGEFVEVFLNGTYHGLYCMTEKIDRKQLRLKKLEGDIIHGALYKSTQWGNEAYMGVLGTQPSSYSNYSDSWAGQWEMKYPDIDDGEPIDWEPLYNAAYLDAMATDDEFDAEVGNYFDLPVLVDYYLFMELTFAYDNDGKNMYYFIYDTQDATDGRKLSIAPWDLDATWGRNWNSTNDETSDPTADWATMRRRHHNGVGYYNRLFKSSTYDFSTMLKERYAELRKDGTIDADALVSRVRKYGNLFADSRADLREQSAWPAYHDAIQDDVDYICEWIPSRVKTMDTEYGYDPLSGISSPTAARDYLGVTGDKGAIRFQAAKPQDVSIYNLQGTLVRSVRLEAGLTTLQGFTPGVYVAAGQKVIVD